MTDVEKQKQMEQIKQSEDGMRQTVLLIKIGLMVFLTFACCTVFFFLVLRYKGVADTWHLITGALQPIIIGLGLAYLLNPVMKFQERHWLPFLKKKMKSEKSAAKVARGLSIAGAILFLLVILVLLIAAIVPSVVSSVTGLVEALPGNVESLIHMVKSGKLGAYGVTDTISDMLTKLTDQVENWATKDLLPQMQQYLLQITSGVITMVKSILNFIIGIIVVVYVLSIKESLVGQSKKIVYAIFKPKHGNIIIEVFHKADEVFGGFIIGKIIDSAIIGVICYFGCLILHIPDTILVAVIIGVTNVIPVFGPFIGAIPTLLLVVIQSPLHALYLLIFIIILQQVDGNIIGPKILGDSTGLSAFWVMFSILIGGGLFGFLGMLLGVPVFAMIYYIIRRLVNHSIRKKNLTTVTEAYVEAAGVDEATGAIIYYGEKQKKKRNKVVISVLFAISGLICWCGISQVISNSVVSSFKNAFSIPPIYMTVVLVAVAAVIVLRKDATVKILDMVVPVMAVCYFAITILVLIFRHYNLPRHYLTATLTRIYLHFLWL